MIDSLRRIVALQRHDSIEMEVLLELTWELFNKDTEKAKSYALKCISLARTLNSSNKLGGAYAYMANLNQNTGMPDSAWFYLSLLEKLSHDNPTNTKVLSQFNSTSGLIYKNQGQYKRALPYLINNLDIVKGENDGRAGLLLNIGNLYSTLSDHKNALNYHLQALALFEKLKSDRGQSYSLQNVGNDFLYLNQYSAAKKYFERSYTIKKSTDDRRGVVTSLTSLGDVSRELGDYPSSERYYLDAIREAQEIKNPMEESKSLYSLGLLYKRKGDMTTARTSINQSLKLARQVGDSTLSAKAKSELLGLDLSERKDKQIETTLSSNLDVFINSGDRGSIATEYQRLSGYYAQKKQFDKAYQYQRKYHELLDSLSGKAVLLQMKQLEEQYNGEKKEREITMLKKDQEVQRLEISRQRANLIIIMVVLVSVIIIGILLVNRYLVKSRARRILEMERMRNSIARDLHDDIGSTLSSINIISQMALQDSNGTSVHFQRIAQHSSNIMESMSDIVWSINPHNDSLEEVISKMKEFACEILDPLEIPFTFTGEEILYTAPLDAAFRKNIFLIFKEAINNTAKYSGATSITINFLKKGSALHLTITDNGAGFNIAENSSGNGLRNMRERAHAINGRLDIRSTPGNGTEVSLILPVT